MRAAAAAAVIAGVLATRVAVAQDFSPASGAGPRPGALALLDRALPAGAAWSAEGLAVRWLGLAALETRAVAMSAGVAGARVAAGLSQTGDPALGWTGLGLAAGGASDAGGAAVRAVARLDRAGGAFEPARARTEGGVEAGAGAWLAFGAGTSVWASAPQLWIAGDAPPLLRPAEAGVRGGSGDVAAWLALAATRRGDAGERSAGIAIGGGRLSAWVEARDTPLRGAVGLYAARGALVLEARVDGHPVLAETSRLSVSWRGRP
jgi:hypothetical protein